MSIWKSLFTSQKNVSNTTLEERISPAIAQSNSMIPNLLELYDYKHVSSIISPESTAISHDIAHWQFDKYEISVSSCVPVHLLIYKWCNLQNPVRIHNQRASKYDRQSKPDKKYVSLRPPSQRFICLWFSSSRYDGLMDLSIIQFVCTLFSNSS